MDKRWLEHSATCEHCGWGKPVAILAIRAGKRQLELAVCAKCEAALTPQAECVITHR